MGHIPGRADRTWLRRGFARARRRILSLCGLALLIVAPSHVTADSFLTADTAMKVAAAFLYNFGKFITWPDSAFSRDGDPFVIAVVGDDPFGAVLNRTMRGKAVHGHHVEIRRVDWFAEADGDAMRRAHIVFIAPSQEQYAEAILRSLRAVPVLTVSAAPQFGVRGGMIRLFLEDGKMRFEINRGELESARLRAGAELLRVASIVETTR